MHRGEVQGRFRVDPRCADAARTAQWRHDTRTRAPSRHPRPSHRRLRPPLRRSRTDRVLGGVAAGFARWLGIDPVIVRVVLVVLAVFGGSGLLLYAVGWLFIPDEHEPKSEAEKLIDRTREPNSTGRTILIVAAVIVGLIVLGGIASSGPWGGAWGGGGWLLLLAAGGLVLWLVNRPPTGTATWIPSSSPSAPAGSSVPVPTPTGDTVVMATATTTADASGTPATTEAASPRARRPRTPPPTTRPATRTAAMAATRAISPRCPPRPRRPRPGRAPTSAWRRSACPS